MANLSKTTKDHEEIRRWAEERGGHPASVKGTGNEGDIGLLRIDFPGYSGEDSLQEITWDEFFEKFDKTGLSLLYQEETAGGERSNFNKLVSAETAAANEEHAHAGSPSPAKRAGAKKAASHKGAKNLPMKTAGALKGVAKIPVKTTVKAAKKKAAAKSVPAKRPKKVLTKSPAAKMPKKAAPKKAAKKSVKKAMPKKTAVKKATTRTTAKTAPKKALKKMLKKAAGKRKGRGTHTPSQGRKR